MPRKKHGQAGPDADAEERMMHRKLPLMLLCLLLALAGAAMAKEKDTGAPAAAAKETGGQDKAAAAKELSGMSIVGNDEVPKSLYIVPWKRSEIGEEAHLHTMLTESAVPVDRDEFRRQLDLYEASTKK